MTKSIVLTICAEHGISPAAFFGKGRTRKMIEARRAAVNALTDAGFGTHATARLMRRNTSTVCYWRDEANREHRRARIRSKYPNRRAQEEERQHLSSLRETLKYCMGELQRVDPEFLSRILNGHESLRCKNKGGGLLNKPALGPTLGN